jgi:hypothetical protein
MKYLAVLLILLLPGFVSAQVHRSYTRPEPVWEVLLKGGWQYTSVVGSEHKASFGSGWNAGVGIKIPIRGALWIQPEILYSKRSIVLAYPVQGGTNTYEGIHTFTYVSYPLMLAYRPNDLVEFHLGPQFGVFFGNDFRAEGSGSISRLSASEFNKWEYAAAAGIEVNMSPLAFGARYAYSFRNIAATEQAAEQVGKARLHGLQLYGALVF